MSNKTEEIVKIILSAIIVVAIISYVSLFLLSNNISFNKKKQYKIVRSIRDISYANIIRKVVYITIPKGLSEKEVIELLKKATKEIRKSVKENALLIKCYADGDDFTKEVYTVGQVIYAPNGKWEDAGISAPKKINITLAKIYFTKDKINELAVGDWVTLTSKNSDTVSISSKRDSWTSEDIIKKVQVGTKVQILEIYEEPITPDDIFKRIKVKIGKINGWVNEHEIKK